MRPSWWVSTTYFAEGLPYMLVRWLSGVYFTDIGLKESVIGALNLLGLPWNWKFAWAPLVDWTGTKRRWLLGVEFALAAVFGVLALLIHLGPAKTDGGAAVAPSSGLLTAILATLVLLAFLAATHDVTIDAFYMEGIPSRDEQARLSGLRVTAYRVAVLFAKFALVALPTWAWGFGAGAAAMLALAVWHAYALPRFDSDGARPGDRPQLAAHVAKTIRSYLAQPRVGVVIAFVTLYKLGDELLFAMNTTFLMRELHVTKGQLAWLSGLVGTVTAVVGALWGGRYIQRVGLRRALWPLTLAMNLNIWAYVWLAWARPDAGTPAGFAQIAVIHGYEQIAAGLGSAALTVFLLQTCRAEFKAAHYAFGSAIMSLTGTLFGGLSGAWVEAHGYTSLYVLAFVGSLPSMLLIPFLPLRDEG